MNIEEMIEAAGKKKEGGMDFSRRRNMQKLRRDMRRLQSTLSMILLLRKKKAKALKVLESESTNAKALYRRAQAYINLVDLDLTEIDIKKALEIDHYNRDVKLEYKVLKEKIKEFNKKYAKFYGNMLAGNGRPVGN
ncbi:hypothetical protein LguiB_015257 [Lonicera macranthoides]